MTTQIGSSVFVDPSEIRHEIMNGTGVLTFGPYPTVRRVDLFLGDVAGIDAVIAELVALRNDMEPYAPPANPPFFASDGEGECGAVEYGWICTAQAGHDGPDHIAYKPDGDGAYHRWPVTEAAAPEQRETAGATL